MACRRWDWKLVTLLLAMAKDLMLRGGQDSSNHDTYKLASVPDAEMGGNPMGEESSASTMAPTDAGTDNEDQQTHKGWRDIVVDKVRPLQQQILGIIKAIFAVIHPMVHVRTKQPGDRGKHLKLLYEYTMKALSFESLLLAALCNHQYYDSINTAFKVSLAMLLIAFITDVLSALLLLSSCNLPIEYLIYMSSITQMLMPFLLLVSYGLQPYMILIAPLAFFAIFLFHQTCLEADSSTLDDIFGISAGIYGFCTITMAIFTSKESVASSPLACSLFLAVFIARYLMLVCTIRPPILVKQAETLMCLLKLLVASTVIFIILEFLAQQLAFVVISFVIIDCVQSSMSLVVNSPRSTNVEEQSDQRKNRQQLLSAVMVSILFMVLTQIYSEHGAAHQEASLGSGETLRVLIYFRAFIWSLNRMLIPLGGVAAQPAGGNSTSVRIWSTLEWVRASIVVVAVLDMICKFGIAFIAGTS